MSSGASTLSSYWPKSGLAVPKNQLITGDPALDAKVLAAMRVASFPDSRLTVRHVREFLTQAFLMMSYHRTVRRSRSRGEFWHAITRDAGWTMAVGPTGVRILLLATIRQLRCHRRGSSAATTSRRGSSLVAAIRAMNEWMELDGDDEVDVQEMEDAERPEDGVQVDDCGDERDFDTMDEQISPRGSISP